MKRRPLSARYAAFQYYTTDNEEGQLQNALIPEIAVIKIPGD